MRENNICPQPLFSDKMVRRPDGKEVFEVVHKIRSCDVDMTRCLRLSTLFSWMQEAAFEDSIRLGVSRQMTLDKGLLWVVTQYHMEIARLPAYDESVTLLTWPGKTLHMFFPRHFMLQSQTGEILMRAVSMWSLINIDTRRIVFPEKHGIRFSPVFREGELTLPSRVRSVPTDRACPFTVPYSYVDLNGHMNNTRYFELASDHMGAEMAAKMPREVSIEYVGEVRWQETISLQIAAGEDYFYMSGEKEKTLFRLMYRY